MSSAARCVLFIDHTARMGGGEVALVNLVVALDRSRFLPKVLLFDDGVLRQKLEEAGVDVDVLPLSKDVSETRKDSLGAGSLLKLMLVVRTMLFAWRVYRYIRRLRPAIVHTNSLKADIIGGMAGRFAGVPVVWHVRDRIDTDYLPAKVVKVFRWLARRVPRIVVANSQATLDTLDEKTRGAANPSHAPASVTRLVIHDGTLPVEDVVLDANDSRPLRIGLVGRITRWKGQHVFIEAARLLQSRCPQCHYQIIGSAMFGEDAYESEVRATVEREGLQNVVEFTGFRADINAAIAQLGILVHASITGEPFGQVIVEGMVAGKPVVATNGGGVPEIVQDGQTGYLVPMGDAPAMADAIERLANDAALRDRMGEAGRQRVLDHFTIAHTVEKMQNVYGQILASPNGRTV